MKWSLQSGRDRIAGSTERRSVSDMRLSPEHRQERRAAEPQREGVGRAQPARVRGGHLDLDHVPPEVHWRRAAEAAGGHVEAEPGRERPALEGGVVAQRPALGVAERVRRHRVAPGLVDHCGLVGLRAADDRGCVGQRLHLQGERRAVRAAQAVRRRHLDGGHADVAGLGRAAEDAGGLVKADPAGQGAVVAAGGRHGKRVPVRVREHHAVELPGDLHLHALVVDAACGYRRPVDHVEAAADRGHQAAPHPGAGRGAQLVAGPDLVQRDAREAGLAEVRRLGRRPVQRGAAGVGLEADGGLRVVVDADITMGVGRADDQGGQVLAAVHVRRLRREDEPVGHAAQGHLPDAALPGHEGELGAGEAQLAAGAAGVADVLRPAVVAPVVLDAVHEHALGERPPDEHGGEQGVVDQVELVCSLVRELAHYQRLCEARRNRVPVDVAGQHVPNAVAEEHVEGEPGIVSARDRVAEHAVVTLVDAHGKVGQGDSLVPGHDRVADHIDAAAVDDRDRAVDVLKDVVADHDRAGPVQPVRDVGVVDGDAALQAAAWGGVPEEAVLHQQPQAVGVAGVRADQVRVGDLEVDAADRDVELSVRRQDRQRGLSIRHPDPVDRRADRGDDGQALIDRHGLRVRAARDADGIAVTGGGHRIRDGAVAGRHRHRTVVRIDYQGRGGVNRLSGQAHRYQCQKHQEL